MGFSEDDRIRSKNRVWNEASDMYEGMLKMGFTHSDIAQQAAKLLESSTDSNRNEIYQAMLVIAGRVDNVTYKDTDGNS
jgi:hypothetical protein